MQLVRCCFSRLGSEADCDLDASRKIIPKPQSQHLSVGTVPPADAGQRQTEEHARRKVAQQRGIHVHSYRSVVSSLDARHEAAVLLLLRQAVEPGAAPSPASSSAAADLPDGIDLGLSSSALCGVAGKPGAGQQQRQQLLQLLRTAYSCLGSLRLTAQHLNAAAHELFDCRTPADYQTLLAELVVSEPQLAATLRDCCQADIESGPTGLSASASPSPSGEPKPLTPASAARPLDASAGLESGGSCATSDGARCVLVVNHPRHCPLDDRSDSAPPAPPPPPDDADLTLLVTLQTLLVQLPPQPPSARSPAVAAAAVHSVLAEPADAADGPVLLALVLQYQPLLQLLPSLPPPAASAPPTRGLTTPLQRGYAVLAALPGMATMLTGDGKEVLYQNAASVAFMGLQYSAAAATTAAEAAAITDSRGAGLAAAAATVVAAISGAAAAASDGRVTGAPPGGAISIPGAASSLSGIVKLSGSRSAGSSTVPLDEPQLRRMNGGGGVLEDLFAMAPAGQLQELLVQVATGQAWRGIIPVPPELTLALSGVESRHEPLQGTGPPEPREAVASRTTVAGTGAGTASRAQITGGLPAICFHSDREDGDGGASRGGIASFGGLGLSSAEENVFGESTNVQEDRAGGAKDRRAHVDSGGGGGRVAAAVASAGGGAADAAAAGSRIKWPWRVSFHDGEVKHGKGGGGGSVRSGATRGSRIASTSNVVAPSGAPGARRLRFSLSIERSNCSAPPQLPPSAAAATATAIRAAAEMTAGGSLSEELERSASTNLLSTIDILAPLSSAASNVRMAPELATAASIAAAAAAAAAADPADSTDAAAAGARRLASVASAGASSSTANATRRRLQSQSATSVNTSARRITFGPAGRQQGAFGCPDADADSLRTSTWGLLDTMRWLENRPPASASAAVSGAAAAATTTATTSGPRPDGGSMRGMRTGSSSGSLAFRGASAISTAASKARTTGILSEQDPLALTPLQECVVVGDASTAASALVASAARAPPPRVASGAGVSCGSAFSAAGVGSPVVASSMLPVCGDGPGNPAATSGPAGADLARADFVSDSLALAETSPPPASAPPPPPPPPPQKGHSVGPPRHQPRVLRAPTDRFLVLVAAAAASFSTSGRSTSHLHVAGRAKSCVNLNQTLRLAAEASTGGVAPAAAARAAAAAAAAPSPPLPSSGLGAAGLRTGAQTCNVRSRRRASVDWMLPSCQPSSSPGTAGAAAASAAANSAARGAVDSRNRGELTADGLLPVSPLPQSSTLPPPPEPVSSFVTVPDDASSILDSLAPPSAMSGFLLLMPPKVPPPPPPPPPSSISHRHLVAAAGGGDGARDDGLRSGDGRSKATEVLQYLDTSGGVPSAGMQQEPVLSQALTSGGLSIQNLDPTPGEGLSAFLDKTAAEEEEAETTPTTRPPLEPPSAAAAVAPAAGAAPPASSPFVPCASTGTAAVEAAEGSATAVAAPCVAPRRRGNSRCRLTLAASCAGAAGSSSTAGVVPAAAAAGNTPGGGYSSLDCCWHEVTVCGMRDPVSGRPALLVLQLDVTSRVRTERLIAEVLETEHRLLESIFPRHVLEVAAASRCGGTTGGRARAAAAARDDLHGANVYGNIMQLPLDSDCSSLATDHPMVTILFADIIGFTEMCHSVPPGIVMQFLNQLYSRLDSLLDVYGVYKVETIGDCYMVAGGLMTRDAEGFTAVRGPGSVDELHAAKVLAFAKAMLREASKVSLPTTGKPVLMRIGLHSGPVMSGIVGARMPRFCLFGDTVNTASRMESTCRPGCIHVSAATRGYLTREAHEDAEGRWQPTGGVQVKGKGLMHTYLWQPQHLLASSSCVSGFSRQQPGQRQDDQALGAGTGLRLLRPARGGGRGGIGGDAPYCATSSLPVETNTTAAAVSAFIFGGESRWGAAAGSSGVANGARRRGRRGAGSIASAGNLEGHHQVCGSLQQKVATAAASGGGGGGGGSGSASASGPMRWLRAVLSSGDSGVAGGGPPPLAEAVRATPANKTGDRPHTLPAENQLASMMNSGRST